MATYKLLSIESDAKTIKGSKSGYLTGILYFAPATEADGVHDMCPGSTAECRQACLNGAGMAAVFPSIKAARVKKTLAYLENPELFVEQLAADVIKLQREAVTRGLVPAVRLNGTSDLPKLAHTLARMFPTVQFYDYTKLRAPWQRTLPNYHLTYSYSGANLPEAYDALEHGVNVAVVFSGSLPATWHGYPVINGDENDLRFTDPTGVIVGLKAKGPARKMAAGSFIQLGEVA